MRTLFLVLATSATIFATGVTPVAAGEYRYCLQGDYAGAGDCEFTSYLQCQATASGRTAYCAANPYLAAANPYLANDRRPDNSCQAASSLTPRASS